MEQWKKEKYIHKTKVKYRVTKYDACNYKFNIAVQSFQDEVILIITRYRIWQITYKSNTHGTSPLYPSIPNIVETFIRQCSIPAPNKSGFDKSHVR